jgi:transposase
LTQTQTPEPITKSVEAAAHDRVKYTLTIKRNERSPSREIAAHNQRNAQHRARQLLVRQRTMLSNALRGHLAELGIVSAKGRNGTAELLRIIESHAGGIQEAKDPLSVLDQ